MGHFVTSEISKRSKWWIPKYRFLELKYFCLQYPEWKKEAAEILFNMAKPGLIQNGPKGQLEFKDSTGDLAVRLAMLNAKIDMLGEIARSVDDTIGYFILRAVTEDISFVKMKTLYDIPCERDMYYDRYRKFFYILSRSKD